MTQFRQNMLLALTFGVLLTGLILLQVFFRQTERHPLSRKMQIAKELTEKWFRVIEEVKIEKGIHPDIVSNVPWNCLIGNDWSEITTTLGSLAAKETATNPDFAALMVRLIHEADVKENEKVGILLSGSFPALAVATLAALQVLEIEAVIISSLGASTYGANQPAATWIDLESWLRERGSLRFQSALVTRGAEGDSGLGLSAEGLEIMQAAAVRNHVELFIPNSITEAISRRIQLFEAEKIKLLINIGGNQAALGACPHAATIPNGLHSVAQSCLDENRGVIMRLNERGIPFIHLLNIKDLAMRYGIPISPGTSYGTAGNLYHYNQTNKLAVLVLIWLCGAILWFGRK